MITALSVLRIVLLASLGGVGGWRALAQTTTITYQGHLTENGAPANGLYDFLFKIFNQGTAGTQISSTLTKGNQAVSNGLFTVSLDFGANVFNGSDRWLEIAVRLGDSTNLHTTLAPRQKLTSTPYAIRAANFSGSVNATQITGTIASTNLADGSITGAKLSAGAAAANLAASGQAAVPTGGIVFSTNANDANLINAGYAKLGTAVLNDNWQQRGKTNAPSARRWHTAVWTGSEMLIWGGDTGGLLDYETNTGGRYNPLTDTWSPISTNGAPKGRARHTALWTGTEMIIWGGEGDWVINHFTNLVSDGGRYNPATDSWTPVSTNGAPLPTARHSAVWTGTEMIIWGGALGPDLPDPHDPTQIGARYDPATDTWTMVSTNNAPDARYGHVAAWTGTEMLVCSGRYNPLLNSRRYNPVSDTWDILGGGWESLDGHASVWTGSELIVWGGVTLGGQYRDTGLRYNPTTGAGNTVPNDGSPAARKQATAVWTGDEMIIWGGYPPYDSGGRYNPVRDAWNPLSTEDGPTGRWNHTALWTGREMLVWGGEFSGFMKDELWIYTPPRVIYLYFKL